MKEKISRQIIRLLRDIVIALRARDESLRGISKDIQSVNARLESIDGTLDTLLANQREVLGRLDRKIEEYGREAQENRRRLNVLEGGKT